MSQSQGIYESARSVQSMGRSHRCDSHQSVRLEAALLQRHTTPAKHLLLLRLHFHSFQLRYAVTKPGLTLITSAVKCLWIVCTSPEDKATKSPTVHAGEVKVGLGLKIVNVLCLDSAQMYLFKIARTETACYRWKTTICET